MFRPTRYLDWASSLYGKVRFDLATSGVPALWLEDIGPVNGEGMRDADGGFHLRNAIARYNAVPHDNVVAALGTTQALWIAYAALTQPGDEVLVESPAYEPLVRIAEGVGAHIVRFERSARDRFALDPERVAAAMNEKTRVVAISNLHNPSGARASDEAIVATARLAAAHGAHLVVDEVYAPFDGLVDDMGIFRGSARRLGPNVVTVSSLTKCYGQGHERIGWVLAAPDVVARAKDVLTATVGMLPFAHTHRALAAFARVTDLAGRARDGLAGKRARVTAWVASHDLHWSFPPAGTFGFIDIPGRGDLTPAIESSAAKLEVLVAPGAFFGSPEGFRIAWPACDLSHLDEALSRLAVALAL